jgi:hypothetical protein
MLMDNMNSTLDYSTDSSRAKPIQVIALLIVILSILLSACDVQLGYSVVGDSQLTGAQVDAVLCGVDSPACGTGVALHDLADKYNVKVTFAMAVFKKESAWGTKGVARATLGIGNIRCAGWHGRCVQGFRAYSSWVAGYDNFFYLISDLYIKQWKLTDVQGILAKYAPTSENDTNLYISQVEGDMDTFERGGK